MGNQQERSLAWLAGILEGEGSIGFQVYTMPDKRVRITPYFAVVNSDMKIIAEVCRVFDTLGVKWRDCNKKRSTIAGGSFAGSKFVSCIRVDGQKPCRILAESLYQYMVGEKRKNAEAIVSFLESRAARGLERNEKGHCRRVEYSVKEIEIISAVRSHKRAKSSEAIRSAPNVVG
jgi:hypothetical protein